MAGAALFGVSAAGHAQAPPGFTISTIAGIGSAGYGGDGGPATAAQLNNPCALALDSSANLYIGDQVNYRVRKMTVGGNINTYAGTGTAGDSGTGGAATSAAIRNPCGMTVNGSGTLFFADTGNHEIKQVVSGGTLTTIAGTGTGGYAGDQHSATGAQFDRPTGVALDGAGNLYIADSGNNAIRILNTAGNMMPFSGSSCTSSGCTAGYAGDGLSAGQAQLSNPTGLAMDAVGNLYVADTDNGVIRKITPGGGTISTYAGNGFNAYSGDGGPATQASLNHPRGVAVDASGNLYIADTNNNRIRVVLPNGNIYTVAGTGAIQSGGDGGPATRAQLNFPTGVAVDTSGNVYVADTQNSNIRLLTLIPVPAGPPAVKGVVSASDFGAFPTVAPGSWIEIYGSNLAGDTRLWTSADFTGNTAPISLDQTSVTIGGQNAYVSAISPGQVNVQVPSNVGPGPQPLVVQTPAGSSTAFTITVKATQPGLYAPALLLVAGKQYTAQFNDATRTFIMPAGAVSGVNSSPAHVGDVIVLYGTGFGPVTPASPAGQVVTQLNALSTPVQFSVGGVPATTMYAGLAPQAVGLYQFNLVVPNVAPGSAVPLTFSQGGAAGTQTLYIAVQ
jgi:uncharacterized protein (TIGR03437 family)